jgi:uncharacterized protein involved in outer membrane biogenesis/uncharacterized membrane protein
MNADSAPAVSPWLRRIRLAGVALVALAFAIAIVGFLVVPRIVKAKLETYATEATGRKATLGKVEFNPFTLRGTLTDFTLAHRASEQPFVHFDALDVEVSPATLWRRAPVLNAIRVTRPTIAFGRNADGTYDIQDLIDAWAKASADPTPPFSLNNIEIEGGAVSLDDRMRKNKVALANLAIGIPFLSSLPHDAAIRVNPRLEGVLEGAHFMLKGTTSTPFADRKEAALDIDFDAFALAEIAHYVPLPQGLKLKDGALTTRLKLAFASEKGEPRAVTVSGAARVDRLAVVRSDDSPLIGARSIVATLGKLDPLGRAIVLDAMTIDAPEFDLKRGSDGVFELKRLFAPDAAPSAKTPGTSPAPAAAWTYAIAELHVTEGKVRLADDGVTPAFRIALAKVNVEGKKIASSGDAGALEVAFDSEAGAHFGGTANLDIAQGAARGHFSLTKFRLAELYPYYADAVNLDVRRGEIDFTADFDTTWSGASTQLTLAQGSATLGDVELAVRGERDALWRVPKSDLSGIAFDLGKRSIVIDRLEARPLSLRVIRHADGDVNFERLLRASGPRAASSKAPAAQGDDAWNVVVRKLMFERLSADFEDQMVQPPVKLSIPEARIAAENVGSARGTKGTIEFAARIGSGGRVRAAGVMATRPFAIDWKIDVAQVDLLPLRPYFEAQTNVIVTSGALTANGRLAYGGTGPAGPAAAFAGNTTISDFGSLDRPTSQELLRWKTLTITGVDVADTPRKVALGSITLDEFYARLIVNPDATLNLQRLLAPGAPDVAPAPAPKPAAISTSVPAAKPPASPTTTPAAKPTAQEAAVSIGDIKVSKGDVQFSDFYIKPNYSAHLTDVSGSVSALSATQAGKIEMAARVGNLAPVEVHGTVNPFAQALTLDLTAKATGVDLPPLSTYSGKYAGYGITKGALSFDVHYKIDNRRLVASNKLVLDQLTFGDRVESPTATKLPILLAVALLKDGNGAIRLDLPVQGSLDDPEFSVWGIIVQIIVNLIGKAVTAPFALIGALVGSHADELAFIEFTPGRADLSPPNEAKLQALAKGLADRPALKLDIAGRAVPDADREGLKRVALDRAMRAQKQKVLVARGDAAPSLEALTIDAAERPALLAAVYRDTDLKDKPRNVIGFAKDIPPAEMESLLLGSYSFDDESLRLLANQRSEIVKEWFTGKGGIASDRMFIVAPRLSADGIQDNGAPTRVDFAIR